MTTPYYPGPPPHPGAQFYEVLQRLDLMERKIDWIARHIDRERTHSAHDSARDSVHAPSPRSAAPASGRAESAEPAKSVKPAEPAQPAVVSTSPGAPDRPEARPRPNPVEHSSAPDPERPPSIPPAGARHDAEHPPAAHSPAVAEPAAAEPVAHEAAPPAPVVPEPRVHERPVSEPVMASYGSYGPNRPQDPYGRPQASPEPDWRARVRSEGNVGRYLLSGAAALLVVLAAVSLIALVWNSIPDVVKTGTLGLVAVALVLGGTTLAMRTERQKVAASTLTGTGGALGFVAIIGSVLLDVGLPVFVAFALMALWSVVLLYTARVTGRIFTAFVSGLGTLVTIGFARWYVLAHPDTTVLTWSLVCFDVLVLAVIAGYLGRFSPRMRLAPWFPVTAVVPTAVTVLLTPTDALDRASHTMFLLLLFLPLVLLGLQVLDAGPRIDRAGWHAMAGIDWSLLGVVLVIAQLKVSRPMFLGPNSGGHEQMMARLGAVVVLLIVCLAGTALLAVPAERNWRERTAVVHLTTAVVAGLLTCAVDPRLFPLAALTLTTAAIPAVRGSRPGALVVVAISGVMAAVTGGQPTVGGRLWGLGGIALVLLGTIVLEQILRQAPPRYTDASLPGVAKIGAEELERMMRRPFLTSASWLLAMDLVVVAPVLLGRILKDLVAHPGTPVALAASLAAIVLVALGLLSDHPTPIAIFSGSLFGRRTGLNGTTATVPGLPVALTLGYLAMAALALSDLAVASLDENILWQVVLVVVALGSGFTASWLLGPWLRRPLQTLAAAGLMSVLLWWSVTILTDQRPTAVLLTVTVLLTGAVCIVSGFRLRLTTLRHYGLVLVLFSVLKLAVLDIGNQNSLTRIVALAAAGLVCFGLSLAYNRVAADERDTTPPPAPGTGQAPPEVPGYSGNPAEPTAYYGRRPDVPPSDDVYRRPQ